MSVPAQHVRTPTSSTPQASEIVSTCRCGVTGCHRMSHRCREMSRKCRGIHIVPLLSTSRNLQASPIFRPIDPLPGHADDGWSGAPAGVDGAQFALTPCHASQPSSCLPWWAHAQGERPPAVGGLSTDRRRTRSISRRVGHGRLPGRFLDFFPRCAQVFPAWGDYDDSGTVVGRGPTIFYGDFSSCL